MGPIPPQVAVEQEVSIADALLAVEPVIASLRNTP